MSMTTTAMKDRDTCTSIPKWHDLGFSVCIWPYAAIVLGTQFQPPVESSSREMETSHVTALTSSPHSRAHCPILILASFEPLAAPWSCPWGHHRGGGCGGRGRLNGQRRRGQPPGGGVGSGGELVENTKIMHYCEEHMLSKRKCHKKENKSILK